jgi:hypothetical protein
MVPQSDLNCAMTTPNRALIKKHNWDSDCIEHLSCKEQKDFWWNYHSCRGCKAELLIGLLRWLWRYSNIEEDIRKKTFLLHWIQDWSQNSWGPYSLWFHIGSCLGQQHGHQSTNLIFFSIKIFTGKLYMYILMKVIFKTNLFIWFSHFETQRHKSYSWFIFSMFDSNLVQNDF